MTEAFIYDAIRTPRGKGKQGGAWMTNYREQFKLNGEDFRPHVSLVLNFTKPTESKPSLLTYDEVRTFLHEFGHSLHSMLSQCTYMSQSGTNVYRDFVELPSQIMENWMLEPELLKTYARHYQTGAVIPDDLVAKLEQSSLFNQGFATVEYLAASILDMKWHELTASQPGVDVDQFEANAMNSVGLIPEITSRYRSTYFNHIFNGGYSAGYYVYIWAAQLDADAFEAFKETGDPFAPEVAQRLRDHIYAAGGRQDAAEAYVAFRGRMPTVEPLLRQRGFAEPAG